MPQMRPPRSPTIAATVGVGADSLFENPHAVLIPWRGRIEMEALDLWKGLDASVHPDTTLVSRKVLHDVCVYAYMFVMK